MAAAAPSGRGRPSLSAGDEGGAGRGYFLPFFEYCLDPAQRLQVLARVIFRLAGNRRLCRLRWCRSCPEAAARLRGSCNPRESLPWAIARRRPSPATRLESRRKDSGPSRNRSRTSFTPAAIRRPNCSITAPPIRTDRSSLSCSSAVRARSFCVVSNACRETRPRCNVGFNQVSEAARRSAVGWSYRYSPSESLK